MSLRAQYKTDVNKEVNGIEYPAPVTNDDGTVPTFTIARAGKANKRYQVALQAAIRPHERARALGTLDPAILENIYMDVFCKTLLKGWRNVKLADVEGIDVEGDAPFTVENAKKLFEALPELYDELVEKSSNAAMFREEENEDAAKN